MYEIIVSNGYSGIVIEECETLPNHTYLRSVIDKTLEKYKGNPGVNIWCFSVFQKDPRKHIHSTYPRQDYP